MHFYTQGKVNFTSKWGLTPSLSTPSDQISPKIQLSVLGHGPTHPVPSQRVALCGGYPSQNSA